MDGRNRHSRTEPETGERSAAASQGSTALPASLLPHHHVVVPAARTERVGRPSGAQPDTHCCCARRRGPALGGVGWP
eukprot:3088330-Rhodomonas_salina.1